MYVANLGYIEYVKESWEGIKAEKGMEGGLVGKTEGREEELGRRERERGQMLFPPL